MMILFTNKNEREKRKFEVTCIKLRMTISSSLSAVDSSSSILPLEVTKQ